MKKAKDTDLYFQIEDGMCLTDIDRIIKWFEDSKYGDDPYLKKLGEFAAYTLREMKKKALISLEDGKYEVREK